MIKHLDVVGKIDTPLIGNKAIEALLVQIKPLMADVLLAAAHDLLFETSNGKLGWIQNDLINPHYGRFSLTNRDFPAAVLPKMV